MKKFFSLEHISEMFGIESNPEILRQQYMDFIWSEALADQLEAEESGASAVEGESTFKQSESKLYNKLEASSRAAALKACGESLVSFKIFIKIDGELFRFHSSDWKQSLREMINRCEAISSHQDILEIRKIAKLGTHQSANEQLLAILESGILSNSKTNENYKRYLEDLMEAA